jgi:hypothetical protein
VEGIAEPMRMRSAGDLVIYGSEAPGGDVSFIREHGAHAGPGATEMHTFIVRPAGATLPADITHPVQLYDHFIRYRPPTDWRRAAALVLGGSTADVRQVPLMADRGYTVDKRRRRLIALQRSSKPECREWLVQRSAAFGCRGPAPDPKRASDNFARGAKSSQSPIGAPHCS